MAKNKPNYALPTGFVMEASDAAPEQRVPDDRLPVVVAPPSGFEIERSSDTPLEVNVTGGRLPRRGEEGFQSFIERGFTEDPTGALKAPDVSAGGAALAGAKSAVLMGGDDELSGLGGAVGNFLGRNPTVGDPLAYLLSGGNPNARFDPGTGDGFAADMERERQASETYKNTAFAEQPQAFMAGFIPGAAASMVLPGGSAMRGASYGRNAMRLGAVGGAYGGISGALNAAPGDRVRGGVTGAGVGAVATPVVGGLGSLAATGLGRLAERTGLVEAARGPSNALNSGWDALFRRANQDPERLASEAQRLRVAGVEPRPVDVVDEAGRRVLRAAAGRANPASEGLARTADGTYIDAQDRVADVALRTMGSGRETSRQLVDRIAAERDDFMTPAMDAVRGQPVPVTAEIANVLSTGEGQRALTAARALLLPPERAQVDAVLSAARAAQKLDPRLPANVQAQLRDQIFKGAGLTVDLADKFSRSLLGRARTANPGLARVATDLGNTVRDAARAASPEYDVAVTEYAARSRVGDAAGGTGRFEGSDFLRTTPDQFRATVSTANRTAPPVSGGDLVPSEADAILLRARDSVVDRATVSPASAIATGKQLAVGSAQSERNLALLGPRRAGQLRDGAQAEVDRVRNTAFVDPRTGSQTQGRQSDSLGEELVNLVPNIATGGKWAVVRGVTNWLRDNGLRGIDAERLTRDALDPDRTDDVIAYLTRRGATPSQANQIIRSILIATPGRMAGSAQATPPSTARQ